MFLYRSPEGETAEGETAATETEVKFYTQVELDAAVATAQKTARSIGYNTGKRDALAPYLEQLKSTPGFEDIVDFDAGIKEALPLASSRKKNARQDADYDRKIKELDERARRAETKYEKSRIDAALSAAAVGVTNPVQVARLLQSEMQFKVQEENGSEEILILGPDGNRLMKDTYTPLTIKDVVEDFKGKNPHFVAARETVSLGTQARTGSPGVATSLQQLVNKPVDQMTPEEKKALIKNWGEGKIDPLRGTVAQ